MSQVMRIDESDQPQFGGLANRRSFNRQLAAMAVGLGTYTQWGHRALAQAAVQPLAFAPADSPDYPALQWDKDWPWWRGPLRNGHTATGCRLPTEFGDAKSMRWQVPIPGRGHSSPVIVGDRVYLTTADEKKEIQWVLAFRKDVGGLLWSEDLSQGGFPENNHAKNTEATPTVACDGERLIAVFFHHKAIHVTALDLRGQTLWKQRVGDFNPQRYEYGYAPSPVFYKQLVIVAAEHDGDSYIVALRRQDGQEVWRIKRPSSISFSTPSLGVVAGRDQLTISGQDKVVGYDPATGDQLWSVPGTTMATCGTLVWAGDIVLASGGYPKAETIAVRATGQGKVLWKNNQKCYEQSMIVVRAGDGQDYLYALTDNGIAFCWRAEDGEEMWRERLRGPVSASPIVANNCIYWANEAGTVYVFAANPQRFELIAENRVGQEAMASPAVSGNELFLRVAHGTGETRQEYLCCIA